MELKSLEKARTAEEESTLFFYLRELHKIPLLSREEELACARLAAQGDERARQSLVQANLRFVVLVAKRYRNRGGPMEDLINEGNIGLLQAAKRFDPERGIHFVSYAVWWIRHAILKALHENSRLIRVPISRAGELSRVEELRCDDMVELIPAAQRTLSLDSPVMDLEDPSSFGASLEDRSLPKPEEVLVGVSLQDELDSVLAKLSDREARILRDRFGLAGGKRISLLEAGRKHGLSKERVRQIEKRALRKIRASDGIEHLKAYAN